MYYLLISSTSSGTNGVFSKLFSRFSPENKAAMKVNGITYLPFGEGPRHCIGMRLALVEAKIALVHVLRKVKCVRSEKTQVSYYIGI